MSERLERYAARLKVNIEGYAKLIEEVGVLLHLHEQFGITDLGGEEELREDLRELGKRLDRDRLYLRKVEEMLNG